VHRYNRCFAPAHHLIAEIATRRLSPVDLVDALLERISAHDPKLHAFVEVYASDARLAAEAADKAIRVGHAVGPLHGIPIALKDLIEIEGRITTGGAFVWRERRSTGSCPVEWCRSAVSRVISGGLAGIVRRPRRAA
jgi:aspartyl-tRNA(Asn)/glutamyl-tRNA(Gln) amidotransferase subunit A